MKILFVLENYFPNIGGVETLFKHLVEQLVAAGHQCTIITSRLSPEDPLLEQSGRLTIVRIPVGNRYFFTFRALAPIFRHIRSCDLVQTTSYNAALPAFLGALFFRKKIVVTFHEAWGRLWFQLPYMGRLSQLAHYCFEQLLLRLPFDRFIAVSQSTAARLQEEGVRPARITTIYNGIDYREFAPAPELPPNREPFTFTYFGRLGISKGLDLILAAAADASRRLPSCRLQLIVPTRPPAFLEMIRQGLHGEELEEYLVWRHDLSFADLKTAIRASHCILIPSYSEGFCFAAVETAALRRPILSSGRGSLPEVVSGKFVTMKALSPAALVEAMEKAYRGEWEERPLQRFELEDTVQNYVATYRKLLQADDPS